VEGPGDAFQPRDDISEASHFRTGGCLLKQAEGDGAWWRHVKRVRIWAESLAEAQIVLGMDVWPVDGAAHLCTVMYYLNQLEEK